MLTDTALRNLKPNSLTYKASDRDQRQQAEATPAPQPYPSKERGE